MPASDVNHCFRVDRSVSFKTAEKSSWRLSCSVTRIPKIHEVIATRHCNRTTGILWCSAVDANRGKMLRGGEHYNHYVLISMGFWDTPTFEARSTCPHDSCRQFLETRRCLLHCWFSGGTVCRRSRFQAWTNFWESCWNITGRGGLPDIGDSFWRWFKGVLILFLHEYNLVFCRKSVSCETNGNGPEWWDQPLNFWNDLLLRLADSFAKHGL